MKKLAILISLLFAISARAQLPIPSPSFSYGGNITAANAACNANNCVLLTLPSTAATLTVGVTGTFNATLKPEESQDNGITWTSAGSDISSTGTTVFVVAAFTNFRVRGSAYTSGNAGVNINVSTAVTSSGGGGSPAGSAGDVQVKLNATTFAAGHINDNSTTMKATEDIVEQQGFGFANQEIAGAGGVAANTIVTFDTSNPSLVITAPTNTTGILGITRNAAAPGASVDLIVSGDANCIADNVITAGHLVGVGSTTAGACKDLGVTQSSGVVSNTQIVGKAEAGALLGAVFEVHVYGPGHYGTLVTSSSVNTSVCSNNGCPQVDIASGAQALNTATITAGTCDTVVSVVAAGVLTTDNILADFNADPTGTTGYNPATGLLTIIKYPTAGHVNFKVCNLSGGDITPGAVTLNWRVVR